jgi:hypothetical protein
VWAGSRASRDGPVEAGLNGRGLSPEGTDFLGIDINILATNIGVAFMYDELAVTELSIRNTESSYTWSISRSV